MKLSYHPCCKAVIRYKQGTINMSKLVGHVGIDEAGRGPMIGPLVVAGVLVDDVGKDELERLGVRDSKALSVKRREVLASSVRKVSQQIDIRTISAKQIDDLRKRGTSLNQIEEEAFASILQKLRPSTAYLDAADVIASRFGETVKQLAGHTLKDCKVIAEHKADAKYRVVSAASIIAKVERDRIIKRYHVKYGDFGSGYPNDPKSKRFVEKWYQEHGKMPSIVRLSWESIERIKRKYDGQQTRLDV